MEHLWPNWWDTLTILRLMASALLVVGLFMIGVASQPWLMRSFDNATRGYVSWMVATFDRMFITVNPSWCVGAVVSSTILFALIGWWLTSGLPMGAGYLIIRLLVVGFLAVGPFGLPLGFSLPRQVVRSLWKRRLKVFEDQLLDALSFMSNGLRSGLSLVQSMDMVAQELDEPISQEFGLVMAEQRVGTPLEDALLNLEKRIPSEDVQILVTSINILRQSGGNLSETFQTIAHTVRERKKVAGRIKTLTAQGVSQAVIITIMPFGLGFVLWMFDNELVARLWTTALGWFFIALMLFLQTVGALLMKRMVTIRV